MMRYLVIIVLFLLPLVGFSQTWESSSRPQSVSIRRVQLSPPNLQTSIRFEEPSGNAKLDPEETGTIIIEITNSGQQIAQAVSVKITPRLVAGLRFDKQFEVGNITANQTQILKIPIEARVDALAGRRTIRVLFSEASNFAPNPQRVRITVGENQTPFLTVRESVIIDDSDQDGIISAGEIVSLQVTIKNDRPTSVEGISVEVMLGENIFMAGRASKERFIGRILGNGIRTFNISVYASPEATRFPVSIGIKSAFEPIFLDPFKLDIPFLDNINQPDEMEIDEEVDSANDPIDTTQNVVSEDSSLIITSPVAGVTLVDSVTVQQRPEVVLPFISDIDQDQYKTEVRRPDAIAVVIGNQNYQNADIPTVAYAQNDAASIKSYLINRQGFSEENILYYKDATKSQFEVLFGTMQDAKGKLSDYLTSDSSDVFVYYSGHGAPDLRSNRAYFLPADADPQYIRLNGYSVDLLYQNLAKLEARSVIVVLDACFSGFSNGGPLLQEMSSSLLRVTNPALTIENGAVFAAGQANQVSSWFKEQQHGLFTYYYIKGLQGEADLNRDRQITQKELAEYVQDKVSRKALRLFGRKQAPFFYSRNEERLMASIQQAFVPPGSIETERESSEN